MGESIFPSLNTVSVYEKRNFPDRKGSANSKAKLKDSDIPKIRKMLKEGMSTVQISPLFNVRYGTIYAIKTGKTWSHIKDIDNG